MLVYKNWIFDLWVNPNNSRGLKSNGDVIFEGNDWEFSCKMCTGDYPHIHFHFSTILKKGLRTR